MIKKILIGFALATVIVLLLIWLVTGGPRKIGSAARGLTNSLGLVFWSGTSTGTVGAGQFRLPWQPGGLTLEPDVSEIDNSGVDASTKEAKTPEEELSYTQKEYDALMKQIEEAKTFGELSPYRGKVRISSGGAAEGPVSAEYIEMEAVFDNTAPVGVAGWSLQSALTGIRAHFPRGTNLFILGAVNDQQDIYLNPGAGSIIASAPSPVGTSFRENSCTGYLGELQKYIPPLSRGCPLPSDSLPLTPENLRAYGDACFDFVAILPACTFPRDVPQNISPACRIFLSNTLSYNGCVEKYRYKSDFVRDSWRIYLNAGGELWRNSHDVIRLLDAEGRTVDVVSY